MNGTVLPSARTISAGRDLRGRHVEDAVDLLAPEEHAEQLLAAGQPADPEVPRERLGADVAQRDLELVLLELVSHVEDELVGGAEAGGALRGGDHHRPWVVEEARPALGGADGALEVGDPVRIAARPDARHDVEVVQVSGGDHQVVVVVGAVRGLDALGVGVDPGGLGVDEMDSVGLERLGDGERHVARRALAERDPDQRWIELELVGLRDDRDVDVVSEVVLDGERCGQPREVAAEHENPLIGHLATSPSNWMATRRATPSQACARPGSGRDAAPPGGEAASADEPEREPIAA